MSERHMLLSEQFCLKKSQRVTVNTKGDGLKEVSEEEEASVNQVYRRRSCVRDSVTLLVLREVLVLGTGATTS